MSNLQKNQSLILVEEEADNRSLPEVIKDVHLTNLGLKEGRTFEQQVADRLFLQDCLICWDLAGQNPPIRSKVQMVLMERYWLIGDEVRVRRRLVKQDDEFCLTPLPPGKESKCLQPLANLPMLPLESKASSKKADSKEGIIER